MKHEREPSKKDGRYYCKCGYFGTYRQVGSHVGFMNRGTKLKCPYCGVQIKAGKTVQDHLKLFRCDKGKETKYKLTP